MFKTRAAKEADVKREWYVIDVKDKVLGRVSTVISQLLSGKNKQPNSANIDLGDHVIVINAEKIAVTGKKMEDKMYYSHSGYPGALRERKLKDVLEKNPEFVIESSVKGMLPNNKLRSPRMARLHIFTGAEHDKAPQKPKEFKL